MKIRIGSRGSKLALWQAHHIRDRLLATGRVSEVELTIIKTTGDRIQDVALAAVGGKGLFTKEIEEALLDGVVDVGVHSMKDMPALLPEGLGLLSVPERTDPRDAFVARLGSGLRGITDLPSGAVVGTSSLRRSAQLLLARPDLKIVALRGNVDTRLRKLDAAEGGLEAILLACAGLARLGWGERITAPISIDAMLPAVGQGALALEARVDDAKTAEILALLDDARAHVATDAERAFMARLEGNCQVPVAGHATIDADEASLTVRGLVADSRGIKRVSAVTQGPLADARALGVALAERLLADGAGALLAGGA